jgi:predicted transcriptional regulator
MAFILTNPGVYLREISEDLGLAMGVVQYHTWVLTKNGEVEECRSGRYRRFFGAGRYQEDEREVISLMRRGTTGKILLALSENQVLAHVRLARLLGISSQALSWQMRLLKRVGVVDTFETQVRGELSYRLVDGIAPIVRSQAPQRTRVEKQLIPVPAVTD